ncbi:hypothetical protein T484DRAFT_1898088 [Baffinella frigidus]|nr:hypothetical protein T484DRAFT_1898088 [Cryptophyta sp. CCMP2293]
MTRQSPRTVGFGVRVTGHAGAQEPAGGAVIASTFCPLVDCDPKTLESVLGNADVL